MPFVQVADFRFDTERGEQPPAANPEDHLLHQALIRRAPVKLTGYSPVRRVVRRIVAVQEVKLHTAHLDLPGAQPDRVAGQAELYPQPLPVGMTQRHDWQLAGIVIRVKRLLCTVPVDQLAKIALLVEKPHANHRNTQIAGGLELIARHVAQPAGINGQGLAQHELHAEISGTG